MTAIASGRDPLANKIAASVEDVQALLESNANISIAFIALRLRRMEESQSQFEAHQAESLRRSEKRVKELEDRLGKASKAFNDLLQRVKELESRVPRTPTGEPNDG